MEPELGQSDSSGFSQIPRLRLRNPGIDAVGMKSERMEPGNGGSSRLPAPFASVPGAAGMKSERMEPASGGSSRLPATCVLVRYLVR